jgi:hypothetical protein
MRKRQEQQQCPQFPSQPEDPSPFLGYLPDAIEEKNETWDKSHLLSLPKDIRERIYRCVLTDPSQPDMVVAIDRKPSSPFLRHARGRDPTPRFYHANWSSAISTNILLANRLIYREALPILYESVKFMPTDLEGILPVFLDALSPFAVSCVRTIHLCLPKEVIHQGFRQDRSKPFFHWAITCAQVAKLNGTLTHLEIDGDWSIFKSTSNRRGLLFPLCKIKASKTFRPCAKDADDPEDCDSAFQTLLIEAEQALKAKAKIREAQTKAEAAARAERDKKRAELEKRRAERIAEVNNAQLLSIPPASSSYSMKEAKEEIERMEIDLRLLPGIKQFEKELEEQTRGATPGETLITESMVLDDWDLLSLGSGASTPRVRPASVLSGRSDMTWLDTTSTIFGNDDHQSDDGAKKADSDTESGEWEVVER